MKRATPCFGQWVKETKRKLAPRGVKAEFARYLSERYGRPARSWESNLAQIISRNLLPNAEILLAIEGGLHVRSHRKQNADDKLTYSYVSVCAGVRNPGAKSVAVFSALGVQNDGATPGSRG